MATKTSVATITSGYGSVAAINNNFQLLADAIDDLLSRSGEAPNEMESNLDMNGNNILNVGNILPVDTSSLASVVVSAAVAPTLTSSTLPNFLTAIGAVPKTLVDAKGDFFVGTAADTVGRLAVGADGTVLTANSSATEGVAWAVAGFTTGDVKLTIKTVADAGWVLMNDTTIGSASSGATGRANADTQALYTLLWNNTSNADCAVSSGRGASAAADFAANKTIALPKALGRALATYGTGAGLTARTMAQAYGVETHPLIANEMPSHNHGVTDPGHTHTQQFSTTTGTIAGGGAIGDTAITNTSSATTGITIQNNGGGVAHQNMQPTLFLNTMIKL